MKAFFRQRAEVQRASGATAAAIEDVITALNSQPMEIGSVRIRSGTGAPVGKIVGNVGDLYLRTDGGASTVLYVKETGTNTSTGWVGK